MSSRKPAPTASCSSTGDPPPRSEALMKAVSGLPGGGPVHTIFNTHWHPEQTGSNEQLGKAGRAIIAHENTRLWLTTDVTWPWDGRRFKRLPKIAQPNKTFYETGTLDSGVRYGYIPDAAHTDGDLYVHFPEQNVLAVGDAVSGQGWPVVDWTTGGWIGGIVGGLQRLQTLANAETRIVPARGPVLGLSDLKAQYRDVRHDLRSADPTAEQRARAGRGRGGAADTGIRCADGESGRVRAPRIREPVGLRVTGRLGRRCRESPAPAFPTAVGVGLRRKSEKKSECADLQARQIAHAVRCPQNSVKSINKLCKNPTKEC